MEIVENPTFSQACEKFRKFLADNGRSQEIVWLRPTDVILRESTLLYIKLPLPPGNLFHAQKEFEIGIAKKLGILFSVVCQSERKAYCKVWVPLDEVESQYAMMPTGLKLTVPVDSMFTVQEIHNPIRWKYLQIRYRSKQQLRNSLFDY